MNDVDGLGQCRSTADHCASTSTSFIVHGPLTVTFKTADDYNVGLEGGSVMVVVQRNEVSRNRLLQILAIILSAVVLAGIATNFSQSSEPVQALLVLLGALAVVAIVISFIHLFAHPKRSQAILFQ